jgi:hypothetical protein
VKKMMKKTKEKIKKMILNLKDFHISKKDENLKNEENDENLVVNENNNEVEELLFKNIFVLFLK